MMLFARPIAVLALATGFALPAAAGQVAAGDPPAIRSVIQSQIDGTWKIDGCVLLPDNTPTA